MSADERDPDGRGASSPILMDSRSIEPTPRWPRLIEILEGLTAEGRLVVAFSGGVDSTLLAKAARDVAGDRVEAVTAVSPSLAAEERAAATDLARLIGVAHREVRTEEASDPRYVSNSRDRCYWCKAHLFDRLKPLLGAMGSGLLVYGAVTDDLGDDRPGMKAAEDAGARAPLLEAGLGKDEVREASRRLGLPTWNKPALACLASRLPHGTPVTIERLAQVERAEARVRALGFAQVRVRHLGEIARIEVEPEHVPRAMELQAALAATCIEAGFAEAVIDPTGYRPGKLNASGSIAAKEKDS